MSTPQTATPVDTPAPGLCKQPGVKPSVRVMQHKLDFEKVLGVQAKSRSAHFAVHHVLSGPTLPVPPAQRRQAAAKLNLSTGCAPGLGAPVDDSGAPVAEPSSGAPFQAHSPALPAAPTGFWLGTVVPKRHAKRSVTRSLLKRQMRAAMARHASALPPGLWLLRLKAPFLKPQFPSAASDALRAAAGAELDQLFRRAAR
jgi:ribonuclease P protein component